MGFDKSERIAGIQVNQKIRMKYTLPRLVHFGATVKSAGCTRLWMEGKPGTKYLYVDKTTLQ